MLWEVAYPKKLLTLLTRTVKENDGKEDIKTAGDSGITGFSVVQRRIVRSSTICAKSLGKISITYLILNANCKKIGEHLWPKRNEFDKMWPPAQRQRYSVLEKPFSGCFSSPTAWKTSRKLFEWFFDGYSEKIIDFQSYPNAIFCQVWALRALKLKLCNWWLRANPKRLSASFWPLFDFITVSTRTRCAEPAKLNKST